MPCPSGVDIPQNFAFLNNKSFDSESNFMTKMTQWSIARNYNNLTKSKKQKVTAVFERKVPIDALKK
jgi:predicted aldo/keto reductase-like oxidoreductase